MSIRKSLMHYFDKASSKHIPFHPQTESAAITDWHESIIKSLASKVLPTVVSELTTDSVMGKLMSLLLSASGVKYSLGLNGYVKFGSFFGGLIIQWGTRTGASQYTITLPITYTTTYQALANTDAPVDEPYSLVSTCEVNIGSLSAFYVYTSHNSAEFTRGIHWIAVGI